MLMKKFSGSQSSGKCKEKPSRSFSSPQGDEISNENQKIIKTGEGIVGAGKLS